MAEFSAVADQTVNPGEDFIFTTTRVGCNDRSVRHRNESSDFWLSGAVRCKCQQSAYYAVDFGSNVAIPDGGTVAPIQVALVVGGSVDPASIIEITPAAAGTYTGISKALDIPVWAGCCQSLSLRNVGTEPITARNTVIDIDRLNNR